MVRQEEETWRAPRASPRGKRDGYLGYFTGLA